MNTMCRTLLTAFLIAVTMASSANAQYGSPSVVASIPPQANPVPAARTKYPPSWYYNPYTVDSPACPQGGDDMPKCKVLIPPSYPAR